MTLPSLPLPSHKEMAAGRPGKLLAALLLLELGSAMGGWVTCGSVVKLLNVRHGVRLHSHDVRYGSGSGQQSVTGITAMDDSNSYWRVRGKMSTVCERGIPVKCGQAIRLTHINTGRNLHSHHFTSPLSGNQWDYNASGRIGIYPAGSLPGSEGHPSEVQEVSAFGEDGEGDFMDDWIVLCSGPYWDQGSEVQFKHSSTHVLLSVTGEQYGRPIHGQREVHGMAYASQDSDWKAMEGIFVKPTEQLKMELPHTEL